DDVWQAGKGPSVGHWACHAAIWVDRYNEPVSAWPPPDRLGFDDSASNEQIPSQQKLILYIETIRCEMRQRLEEKSDDWFFEPTAFGHTATNRLGAYIYSLRHLLYHTGEVSMALRMQGADETSWH
ncbi:MAG TPA: hypothetical protein VGE01_09415, partial [Fimbriimonas sp.]